MFRRLAVFVCAVALVPSFVTRANSPGPRPEPATPTVADQLAGLRYRSIGPYRGGRATAVAGVPGNDRQFYFGACGGGIWRTDDGGVSWRNLSDKDFKTGSVGAIAVAPSDPNVIYVGMGEAPIRGNVSHGDGVYRSTDRGASWKRMGLENTRQIARVRVHPENPDIVYAAALGHVWGPNPDRGIFRSKDGGKSWEKVLYVSDRTGASDLVMDPTNPRILYAGFWQVRRSPWSLESGGPEGGIWRSADGGDTWTKLGGGLPEGVVGKIGVTVSAARPERLWAIVEAAKGGVFRSDDSGKTWKLVNSENKLRQRAWYYSRLYADPKNPDQVYVLNVGFHVSKDGGQTYSSINVPHGDNHDLWIDPDDPDRMIESNDGGATVTYNGGRSWSSLDNQPTGQFYRVATDSRVPYRIYGAQQDNSTVSIPSRTSGFGIGESDWYPVGGCESGWIAPKPGPDEIVYAGCYGGAIARYDHRTRQEREITAWPELAIGQAPKSLKYRWQWNAPILVSPHDPNTLYHAAQVLLRSRDEGQTWEEISPDLTRNDKTKQEASGGPITKDNTSVETYCTIFALAESPHEAGTIWAGTDDGLVQITRDAGKTWQNVTPKGMPEWIQVNSIDVSPHDKGTAYIAATMYKHDDFRPYIYRTTDYGQTWTRIVNGIPDGAFTRVVREDTARRGVLYAGTETGAFVSLDDGSNWQPFQLNLPVVPITDIKVTASDLVVATQGRGFWILDDLTPVRELNASVAGKPLHVFSVRPAMRWSGFGGGSDEGGGGGAFGRNPANGVVVQYMLAAKPDEAKPLTIEILDGDTVLRTFTTRKVEGPPDPAIESLAEQKAGLNRFVWDMRIRDSVLIPNAIVWGSTDGPKVVPGSYRVRVRLGDEVVEQSFTITANQMAGASIDDYRAQFELLKNCRDRVTDIHGAVLSIRDMKAQINAIVERAAKMGRDATLKEPAKALVEKLSAIERRLVNPDIKSSQDVLNFPPSLDHSFIGITSVSSGADARPTAGSLALFREADAKFTSVMADYKAVRESDVAAFNAAVIAAGVPPVGGK